MSCKVYEHRYRRRLGSSTNQQFSSVFPNNRRIDFQATRQGMPSRAWKNTIQKPSSCNDGISRTNYSCPFNSVVSKFLAPSHKNCHHHNSCFTSRWNIIGPLPRPSADLLTLFKSLDKVSPVGKLGIVGLVREVYCAMCTLPPPKSEVHIVLLADVGFGSLVFCLSVVPLSLNRA